MTLINPESCGRFGSMGFFILPRGLGLNGVGWIILTALMTSSKGNLFLRMVLNKKKQNRHLPLVMTNLNFDLT